MNEFNVMFGRWVNRPSSIHPRVGRVEDSSTIVPMMCEYEEHGRWEEVVDGGAYMPNMDVM